MEPLVILVLAVAISGGGWTAAAPKLNSPARNYTFPALTPTPAPLPAPVAETTPTLPPAPSPSQAAEAAPPGTVKRVADEARTMTDHSDLPNVKYGWYFNPNKTHEPPTAQRNVDLLKYDACYLGDVNEKAVYLTFDEGYENGFTPAILDTLKEKNVKATFFLTGAYIKSQPELVRRMVNEGHAAANHSVNHPSMPDVSPEKLAAELQDNAKLFKQTTGTDMAAYFRPPMGEYSERTLAYTKDLGYITVFWSFAHKDWLVDDQPGVAATWERVVGGAHNGAIFLLHAVSRANTEALSGIIDALAEAGYTFETLDALPETAFRTEAAE